MKKILLGIVGVFGLYIIGHIVLKNFHSFGITNDTGAIAVVPEYTGYVIPPSEWQIYKHMREDQNIEKYYVMATKYGQLSGFIPQDFLNERCFKYSFDGIDKRKSIYDNIIKHSKALDVDHNLVISAIIGEQLRISCSSARAGVKSVVINTTPRRLVSYDFSLGIGGVKPSTAEYIRRNSKYGYMLKGYSLTEGPMTTDNNLMALLPALIVRHIIDTRETTDPGIIGTVYNIGIERRKPHGNPQVGGAEIKIGNHKVTYGELSAFVYYNLSIYQE